MTSLVKRAAINLDFQDFSANKTIKKNQNAEFKMQKTWVPLFSLCTIHAIWSPREERNYVRKDKIRVEKMNLARFSKSFCRKKTSNNYYTTTEILTTIERSLLVQLMLTSDNLEPYMQKKRLIIQQL